MIPDFCKRGSVLGKMLGWPKSSSCVSLKIKETFFMFTNNFIDLDMLSMLALSLYRLPVGRGRGVLNTFQCVTPPCSKGLCGQNVDSTKKLRKPLWTHPVSHSAFSVYCASLFFSHVTCVFTFLEIVKRNSPKRCVSSIFSIKTAAWRFTSFDVCLFF